MNVPTKSETAIYYLSADARAKSLIQELLGFCEGTLADGKVVEEEAAKLKQWLEQNAEIAGQWPADVLIRRLNNIFSDGVITNEELEDLRSLLKSIAPSSTESSGSPVPTALPLDNPAPEIKYPGCRFCLTGVFLSGTREDCEALIIRRGAECQSNPTKQTDYLVIGTLANPNWAFSKFGRKIQKVMQARDAGKVKTRIISEEHWAKTVCSV